MKCRVMVAAILLGCSQPQAEEGPPAQGTIRLDRTGFHGEGFAGGGFDNEWTLRSNEDVVVRLETSEGIANFAVPDHDLQAIVTRSRPGVLRFRALPCNREGGCRFRAVTVIGAGDVVSEGTLRIEPLAAEREHEASTHEAEEATDATGEGTTSAAGGDTASAIGEETAPPSTEGENAEHEEPR